MRSSFLLLVLALALLPACRDGNASGRDDSSQASNPGAEPAVAETKAKSEDDEAILVRVEPVTVRDIDLNLEVTATVESLDVVDVMPERSEPVLEVLVEEGDVVEKDQVLARLRTEVCQLAFDEADVRHTEASDALTRAENEYERNEGLASGGEGNLKLISQRDLETSKQELVVAQTLKAAANVAVDRAQFNLDNCTVRAPIAGTITARDLSIGDYATVGARAFQITDLSAPKAIFFRPQRELTMLHKGQRLQATSEALPGVIIQGEIERIAPTIDVMSGTVKVTAALHHGNVPVPTGILVRIELLLDRHENALLVPKRALLYEGRSAYCFVVRDGKAARIDCVPGFEDPEYLEVLPEESTLTADDQVVVVGADRLAPGDRVELADE